MRKSTGVRLLLAIMLFGCSVVARYAHADAACDAICLAELNDCDLSCGVYPRPSLAFNHCINQCEIGYRDCEVNCP